jgi:hypothetical protein
MEGMQAFAPHDHATIRLDVTDTLVGSAFGTMNSMAVLVYNAGPSAVAVRFGKPGSSGSGLAAAMPQVGTPGDIVIPPACVISLSTSENGVAAICATGETSTIYVTAGDGM